MIITKWLQENSNDFSISLSDNTVIITGDTIKNMLHFKYGNYTLLYEDKGDNNLMWNTYIAMIQDNINLVYQTFVVNQSVTPYTVSETITKTDTYNLTTNIDKTIVSSGTNTGTDNTAITNGGTIGDSGSSTNQVYAYNSSSFENNEKTDVSNTQTINTTGSNNRTLNLANSKNDTVNDDSLKTGTVSTSTSRNLSDNSKIIDDIEKLLPINIRTNLVNIILCGFINIGAYYVGNDIY